MAFFVDTPLILFFQPVIGFDPSLLHIHSQKEDRQEKGQC
jgi:hypothetical protein